MNSSLGYIDWYQPWQMDGNTAVTTIAADIAASRGVIVVNAMGNEGPGDTTMVAPADGDSVFAVGSVNSLGNLSGYSSRGPTADGRTKPDACARGELTVFASETGGYSSGNGTSFAAPIVAGAFAALSQAHPEWSMMRAYEALKATASRAGTPDKRPGMGDHRRHGSHDAQVGGRKGEKGRHRGTPSGLQGGGVAGAAGGGSGDQRHGMVRHRTGFSWGFHPRGSAGRMGSSHSGERCSG